MGPMKIAISDMLWNIQKMGSIYNTRLLLAYDAFVRAVFIIYGKEQRSFGSADWVCTVILPKLFKYPTLDA